MKLKYYLRGVGIGIIVTTLIFVIAMAFTDQGPTRDEIIAEARKLGMVMKNEVEQENNDGQQDEDSQQGEDGQQNDPNAGQDMQDLPTSDGAAGNNADGAILFTIASGEHSSSVIQRLYDVGLIDNVDAFDDFLEAGDQDSFLQPGEFMIPRGSSYEELARILLTKQENR